LAASAIGSSAPAGGGAGGLYIIHYVGCRLCHGLIFESQSQHEDERQVSQIANRRQKLGGSRDLSQDFPPKPKWMCWKTYHQLQRKDAHEVDYQSRRMMAWVDALGGRFLAHQAKQGRTSDRGNSAPDYTDLARSDREAMEWLLANADSSDRIARELAENAKTQHFCSPKEGQKSK
jgi:hypothetical protein